MNRENRKVRSPAFKNSEQTTPQVHHKVIPLHYVWECRRRFYQQTVDTQPGLQFWGCATPQTIKYPKKTMQLSTRRTFSSFSQSEHLRTKYLQRQASLSATKKNKWLEEFSTKSSNVTPVPENIFFNDSLAKGFSIKKRKTGKTSASSVATVQDENYDFNNRMLQQLALTQNNLYHERVDKRRVTTERRRKNY